MVPTEKPEIIVISKMEDYKVMFCLLMVKILFKSKHIC